MFRIKFNGFTLAEALMALGIIGLISALTLPTLISNYKNRVFLSQTQKIYNEISNAVVQYRANNRVDSLDYAFGAASASNDDLKNFLNQYFNVAKICEDSGEGCLADSYKNRAGNITFSKSLALSSNVRACARLKSGTSICFLGCYMGACTFSFDVNGLSGPNIGGIDLFGLRLDYYGEYIEEPATSVNNCNDPSVSTGAYYSTRVLEGCFNRLIASGWSMDYYNE